MKKPFQKHFFRLPGNNFFRALAAFLILGASAFAETGDTNSPLEQLHQQGHALEKAGQMEKAFQIYQQAADQGSTFAMADLYLCYWEE